MKIAMAEGDGWNTHDTEWHGLFRDTKEAERYMNRKFPYNRGVIVRTLKRTTKAGHEAGLRAALEARRQDEATEAHGLGYEQCVFDDKKRIRRELAREIVADLREVADEHDRDGDDPQAGEALRCFAHSMVGEYCSEEGEA